MTSSSGGNWLGDGEQIFSGPAEHDGNLYQSKKIGGVGINYVGNKKRILLPMGRFLWDEHVRFSSVTDLFGGSGAVSYYFAMLGKDVVYNDILASSATQAQCLLAGVQCPISESEWVALARKDGGSGRGFVAQNYVGRFFTEAEASFLDGYRANVEQMYGGVFAGRLPGQSGGRVVWLGDQAAEKSSAPSSVFKAQYAIYAMIRHINDRCFLGGRYYNGQTLAKLGHRLEHVRNGGEELQSSFAATTRKLRFPKYPQGTRRTVYNCDAGALLRSGESASDLLYIDPPYGGDSSDYVALYQFVEEYLFGACLQDVCGGHTAADGSKFSSRKDYAKNFSDILGDAAGHKAWLISFNASSFATLDEILDMVKGHRTRVTHKAIPISYKYRKDRGGATDSEFIILAED